MVMLGMTALGALLLMYLMFQPAPAATADDDESAPDPPPPPRNFTIEQLHVSRVGRRIIVTDDDAYIREGVGWNFVARVSCRRVVGFAEYPASRMLLCCLD